MKKTLTLIISALFIAVLLSACGGSKSPSTISTQSQMAAASAAPAAMGQSSLKTTYSENQAIGSTGDVAIAPQNGTALPSGASLTVGTISPNLNGDKIIYSLNAQIETTKFDDTMGTLTGLLTKFGAFLQSSSTSGSSYSSTTYRSADVIIRVPVANFKGLSDSLTLLGNVPYSSISSDNITAQFVDTQSRLEAYRTEEKRLLAMLDKANTVQDMITIETRLSDVRYQMESLTSTLQNWQNQVSYSTVTLHIAEVSELTQAKPAQQSYWEKISNGFMDTLKGVGGFFKALLMILIVALPVLVLLGLILVIILAVRKAMLKKKRSKLSGATEETPDKKD